MIKIDRCSHLSNQSPDDLLLLNTDHVAVINPDHQLPVTWGEKTTQRAKKTCLNVGMS